MGWFGWTRNNYDKLGHLAQGFVPAILAREILIRTSPLGGFFSVAGGAEPGPASARPATTKPSRWLGFVVVSICLAFSALYELIEWWVAEASGAGADDFLGTQGYAWDTQSDMACALVGALAAVLLFSRWHDRSLARVVAGALRPDLRSKPVGA
jgi:putative membrane protein